MTKCRKKERERGSEGEERKRRRREEAREKRGRIAGKRGRREEAKEKRGREDSKESESALGERGARSTCTLYERNPRRRRWAVVHFMHAYARLY